MGMGMAGPPAEADPRRDSVGRLQRLIAELTPCCRVESLGELLLGEAAQRKFQMRKGAKHTYVFKERVVTVNTHMGAWSMTISQNEAAGGDVKPRRTISGHNVKELRVHTVVVETEYDSFRLTDHRDELHAIEDLWLTYQCSASSTFVDELIQKLEECRAGGGQGTGIQLGKKPLCAHLLHYARRIVEKLDQGGDQLAFGPRKVKKAMKHKVGPVTRYNDRWIRANATDIEIFEVPTHLSPSLPAEVAGTHGQGLAEPPRAPQVDPRSAQAKPLRTYAFQPVHPSGS